MSESAIACKFGGSSAADAAQIAKVVTIIRADSRRRFIVVSAPGKRTSADKKITDLLYLCHQIREQGMDYRPALSRVRDRYEEIAHDLGVSNVSVWLDEVDSAVDDGATRDWVASRGEYIHAKLISKYLGATFVDTVECVRFTRDGRLDPSTYSLTASALQGPGLFVVPGFYGADPQGRVKTFSRGGSDITGAIVARAVGASVYENWTDVDGLLMADPRVVDNPKPMREVTYNELRELAYMGASVLHDEAVFPVREVSIPINIRNTNAPENTGTLIVPSRPENDIPVVGIAGRRGFSTIYIEKVLMNQERGFGRRMLGALESHGVSYEHTPSGIDSMSIIVQDEELEGKEDAVLSEITRVLQPDRVELLPGLALIATVGQGMSHRVGVASRLFRSLSEAAVNVRMINQGASEINILVGVASDDYERAVRAIYREFVPDPMP